MSINMRIKQIRKELGLTQMKFAQRIALSTSYLAGMEAGTKKVNERVIRLIVTEFNINEQWLKTGQSDMFASNESPLTAQLVRSFKSLPPQLQECALKQINALVESNATLDS